MTRYIDVGSVDNLNSLIVTKIILLVSCSGSIAIYSSYKVC